MNDYTTSLGINDTFTFSCSPEVPCFNECCRDLNQFLTPYDVLRLKKNLGLKSTEFLKKYTISHLGPESGLPVVTFRSEAESDHECPFVTPEGCSVYTDRPSSCRAYPIARAIQRSRETGEVTEYFMLINEPHCKGHGAGTEQTVKKFVESQELPIYNDMNDRLLEIISLKNQIMPGPLDKVSSELFYLTCYDLDRFRTQITEENLPGNLSLKEKLLNELQQDDTALLRFGYRWIKHKLFGTGIDK